MREIKFRAWDEATKEMWYPKDYPLAYHSEKFNSAELLQRYDNCMQYTGLKDKNGKEIYEADIISRHIEFYTDPADIGGRMLVKKDITSDVVFGTYCWVKNKYGTPLDPIEARACEIIGNIYENPELLNSEQNPERSDATEDQSGNKS